MSDAGGWFRLARRCAAASRRDGALWVEAACFTAAVGLAWIAASLFAFPGGGLDEARRLGIISASTIAGYSKDQDTHAYAIALAISVLAALGFWVAWCVATGRTATHEPGGEEERPDSGGFSIWRELAVLAIVLLAGLLRFDLATNGWDAPFTFYSEEGEALAWAHVVLRGGVLSRDVYCAYGPLFTYAVVGLFKLFEPTILVFRLGLYLLDLPALLAVYALLRTLGRSRLTAWLGVALVLFHRMWPMPAMSWSLLRAGTGLAAIAALGHTLRGGSRFGLAVSGAAVGFGVFYSQEAGVAAGFAVACGFALDSVSRKTGWRTVARGALALASGFAAIALPVAAWYAARGALPAMVENLSGFARLRVLGHGAAPFPLLPHAVSAWAAAPSHDTWSSLLEAASAYFGPALCAFAAFRVGTRLLEASYSPEVALHAALAVYGVALFASPLSRPDATHVLFAIPPALVLALDSIARAAASLRRPGTPLARRTACATFLVVALAGLAAFPTDTYDNVALFARQAALNLTARWSGPAENDFRALDLPRGGGIRVPPDRADEIEGVVRYIQSATSVSEPFWAFPNEPVLNFLADRPYANPYPNGFFAITRTQRLDLIAAVERSGARYAVVNEKPSLIDGIPSRQLSPELWSYLDSRFVPERRFGRLVVMRRKPDAP